MKVERLQAIRDRIADESIYFNMKAYCTVGESVDEPVCGTASCIAGHAIDMFGRNPIKVETAFDRAKKMLGLNEEQAMWLFLAEWRSQSDVFTPLRSVTREQAIASIDYLIDNKGEVYMDGDTSWRKSVRIPVKVNF